MTYQQYGLIQASDFNTLVGTPTSATADTLNAVLATGNGRGGVGQGAVSQVPVQTVNTITKVGPDDWNNLRNNIIALANHQGSTVTSMPTAAQYEVITATMTTGANPVSVFANNLKTIYTNRNNVAAQGTSSPTATQRETAWTNAITFTHTITFQNGNAARYFFNAGGQIALTFSHPTGSNVNDLWNKLAEACGTIIISGANSGTQTVAGIVYDGVTKIGGSGTPVTLAKDKGYYGLTSTNQEIFKQLATVGPAGYLSSLISVNARTNGSQGVNGDTGSILTITTLWDEIPDGGGTTKGLASSNSTVTCTIRPPGTSYITNTWGTVGVTGSVIGT